LVSHEEVPSCQQARHPESGKSLNFYLFFLTLTRKQQLLHAGNDRITDLDLKTVYQSFGPDHGLVQELDDRVDLIVDGQSLGLESLQNLEAKETNLFFEDNSHSRKRHSLFYKNSQLSNNFLGLLFVSFWGKCFSMNSFCNTFIFM
jgi:hypothetical protein